MTIKGHPDSYYFASSMPYRAFRPLADDVKTDVCIIGAGLAGLSTAHHLSLSGIATTVIEAQEIGVGASGRNGGQVISGFACDMSVFESSVGRDGAKHCWNLSVAAVNRIRQRIATHHFDCHWSDGQAVTACKLSSFRRMALHAERMAKQYGHELQVWDKTELGNFLGSNRYHGAVYDVQAGHLHPLNYCIELAKLAASQGVQIYERTPFLAAKQTNGQIEVKTPRGIICCQKLVYACNTAHLDMIEILGKRIMPALTYMIATEPLAEDLALSLINNGMAVCDDRFVLDYYRLSHDKRLLFGGKVAYSGRDPINLKQSMRQDMLKVFPILKDVDIEFVWGGECDITLNRAPDLGRLNADIYYLQGFSGHGLNTTEMAGKVVADAINEKADDLNLFQQIYHQPFLGGKWFKTPALVLGAGFYRLRDLF